MTVDYTPSFVDGSGSKGVLDFMWPYLREALDGAYVASLDETADAVRLLAERVRVIAEGAGALARRSPCRAAPAAGRSPASCPAATSTSRCSRGSSRARRQSRIWVMLEVGDRFPVEKLS